MEYCTNCLDRNPYDCMATKNPSADSEDDFGFCKCDCHNQFWEEVRQDG